MTLHEISLHRPPLGKTGGLPAVPVESANSLLSVMSCGISCTHTSGIFPTTIFMSKPERKTLTHNSQEENTSYIQRKTFCDKHFKDELFYQWHVFKTCSYFITDQIFIFFFLTQHAFPTNLLDIRHGATLGI